MTDTTQGEGASPPPDEAALFREATDSKTLEQFENPKPEDTPPPEKPGEKPPPEKPPEKPIEEPLVPSGRLREANEELRRVQRERDEFAARFAATQRPQAPADQNKPDLFQDPQGFVMSLVKPLLDQAEQRAQLRLEGQSMRMAAQQFGPELVTHSRQALEHFMQRGDPTAWATHARAMESDHPYGVIAEWFHERSVLHEIGGDPNRYVERKFEERMEKDPEFRKKVFEKYKSQAAEKGANTFRPPVNASVPNMPSLGNIGAAGGDASPAEPSDFELFRAATSAKRR